MREVFGRLEKDDLWEGEVRLVGDVVVADGMTLRVAAGARISAAARPRWSCAVFRAAPEGWPIEASERGACDLVVLGRLEIAGEPGRPVVVAGGPWGGSTLLGSGRAVLRHAHMEAPAPFGLQTFDDARAELEQCRISACGIGLWSWGLSRIRARGGEIVASQSGAQACEGSRIVLEDVSVRAGERGLCAEGWATVSARRCRFVGDREAAALVKDEAYVVAR